MYKRVYDIISKYTKNMPKYKEIHQQFHLEIIRFETLYTWCADKKWETKEMHCISGNDFYITRKKSLYIIH